MFAILGSGFGLYGYLPAIIGQCGQRVILPERYRDRFAARPELQRFHLSIEWAADDDDALGKAEGAIIAAPPDSQPTLALKCLGRPNIRSLIIEKPVATDPALSLALIDQVRRSGIAFRIGYIFRFTGWGEWLRNSWPQLPPATSWSIRWSFMAHHYRLDLDNWKRHSDTGGGAIRFFGIHVIALLAELGYRGVLWSQVGGRTLTDIERWRAAFSGPNLLRCEVEVDCRSSHEQFIISRCSSYGAASVVDIAGPFSTNETGGGDSGIDSRAVLLGRLFASIHDQNSDPYGWYAATLDLWSQTEAVTAQCVGLREGLATPFGLNNK